VKRKSYPVLVCTMGERIHISERLNIDNPLKATLQIKIVELGNNFKMGAGGQNGWHSESNWNRGIKWLGKRKQFLGRRVYHTLFKKILRIECNAKKVT